MANGIENGGDEIDPRELVAAKVVMLQGGEFDAAAAALNGMSDEQVGKLSEGLTQEGKAKI